MIKRLISLAVYFFIIHPVSSQFKIINKEGYIIFNDNTILFGNISIQGKGEEIKFSIKRDDYPPQSNIGLDEVYQVGFKSSQHITLRYQELIDRQLTYNKNVRLFSYMANGKPVTGRHFWTQNINSKNELLEIIHFSDPTVYMNDRHLTIVTKEDSIYGEEKNYLGVLSQFAQKQQVSDIGQINFNPKEISAFFNSNLINPFSPIRYRKFGINLALKNTKYSIGLASLSPKIAYSEEFNSNSLELGISYNSPIWKTYRVQNQMELNVSSHSNKYQIFGNGNYRFFLIDYFRLNVINFMELAFHLKKISVSTGAGFSFSKLVDASAELVADGIGDSEDLSEQLRKSTYGVLFNLKIEPRNPNLSLSYRILTESSVFGQHRFISNELRLNFLIGL